MPPSEFYVRLQHGITGGFAPPTPSAVHILSRSTDAPSTLSVQSHIREDGTPGLQTANAKSIAIDNDTESSSTPALLDELHTILSALPVESPPGSQDIYGLDTSIQYGSPSLQWANGGPAGCGGGTSEVQAGDEDKQKFGRAVEIVKVLVERGA